MRAYLGGIGQAPALRVPAARIPGRARAERIVRHGSRAPQLVALLAFSLLPPLSGRYGCGHCGDGCAEGRGVARRRERHVAAVERERRHGWTRQRRRRARMTGGAVWRRAGPCQSFRL
jgi:hypothetical protein